MITKLVKPTFTSKSEWTTNLKKINNNRGNPFHQGVPKRQQNQEKNLVVDGIGVESGDDWEGDVSFRKCLPPASFRLLFE